MRPITVSWVLTALIVSAAAAPIPAVGPAIGSVERRMEHEVPVFSFKDYTRQPIPPPEERSQIEEAALLEARRLHIINHFPATLTYPDGTPIRSEKRSESLEKQQPALVARTPSVSASQPSVQLLAARAPAPTPAPGEHKEWTQHGDEICGALGQHGTYGQRKVTALTGEDAKYVMGVAQSDILRRSPHKSACGHYDRGQKMTFKPLAKRREELPSKEFGYAMKELGPITPMDYNPSRSKKMHSGVAALVDDEPVTKHNHKHNQYKSGAGYQTVNINELDRVPLPLSQLTGLGPEVKGTFHGFKRRAALEVGHPGMSTMGVGPQVGGIMRRSTVEQIQGPQAKAEPLQRREMINYDLGRPGHDRFGQPMIVSSGGDVLADYHKLYGCGAGNIIPCPKGSSEKKRASDMHPKTPTKPKAEPIPDGDNPRESWKFHQRGPRHFDEPYHMDRHLDLFGGPEKIKAVAASTPASEPTHAKSHLEHHDKEQEKAGGVKKSMEFQEFTPAQMAQFQKQHYSSADGHFGHSLPAVRRHLGGKESVGHKFTEAELEEYKQTHHNFGTRSPEKVEKITRHGSYSTTNVPNKSAEWEAEHTQKGKEGASLVGPGGKHGFNSKVDEGPAYLGGEPGVGSDGKFDPDLYRKTCYPGLKKGMYTAQQNICNGAF